jgi:hypothetical protein
MTAVNASGYARSPRDGLCFCLALPCFGPVKCPTTSFIVAEAPLVGMRAPDLQTVDGLNDTCGLGSGENVEAKSSRAGSGRIGRGWDCFVVQGRKEGNRLDWGKT